jgi:hypothetical protein
MIRQCCFSQIEIRCANSNPLVRRSVACFRHARRLEKGKAATRPTDEASYPNGDLVCRFAWRSSRLIVARPSALLASKELQLRASRAVD